MKREKLRASEKEKKKVNFLYVAWKDNIWIIPLHLKSSSQ